MIEHLVRFTVMYTHQAHLYLRANFAVLVPTACGRIIREAFIKKQPSFVSRSELCYTFADTVNLGSAPFDGNDEDMQLQIECI